MNSKLYMDVHVLQTVPPSCMNRDNNNTPKTAVYGGVQRARVSSQSWKRAMRTMFKDMLDPSDLSLRTKFVLDLVANEMVNLDTTLSVDEAKAKAVKYLQLVEIMPAVEAKDDKAGKSGKAGKTNVAQADEQAEPKAAGDEAVLKQTSLFFLSVRQLNALASTILGLLQQGTVTDAEAKKQLKVALQSNNGIEIELFGRMVASDKDLTVDACAQVAHAISTHAVENEQDFFVAVDDKSAEMGSHGGSAHMGDTDFNSSTLYRYATVAVHDLASKLGDVTATAEATKDFVKAFVSSLPTGKLNSYANTAVPNAVYVSFRTDGPANFAGAFEKAIVGSTEGYVEPSAVALEEYALGLYADFLEAPTTSFVVGSHLPKLAELGQRVPLKTLLTEVEAYITQVAQ